MLTVCHDSICEILYQNDVQCVYELQESRSGQLVKEDISVKKLIIQAKLVICMSELDFKQLCRKHLVP